MDGFIRRDGVDYACRLRGDNGIMANPFFKEAATQEGIASLSGSPFTPQHEDDRSFFNQIHEKFGIGQGPYNNPPEKTTSLFEVNDTPVSVGGAFQNWRKTGDLPKTNLQSLFSSQYMPYALAAGLREHGFPGDKERFEEAVDRGEYKSALAQQGLPFNEYQPSTFSMAPSLHENRLRYNLDVGNLLDMPGDFGDLTASYTHDFDPEDESDVLSLMYSIPTHKLSSMLSNLFGGQ